MIFCSNPAQNSEELQVFLILKKPGFFNLKFERLRDQAKASSLFNRLGSPLYFHF